MGCHRLTLVHVVCTVGWYKELLPIDDWLYISFFDLDEDQPLALLLVAARHRFLRFAYFFLRTIILDRGQMRDT